MNISTNIPYSWAEIEAQLRGAIFCQASILACLGPDTEEVVARYLGVDAEQAFELSDGFNIGLADTTTTGVDITRHGLHRLARIAYDFAYQLDGFERASGDDVYEIACAVLSGFPRSDLHGNPSPLHPPNDEPLRRMFDTFIARWKFFDADYAGDGLTVRELALLSNMTVPAVRTSLSKEGFKLELPARRSEAPRSDDEKSAVLDVGSALSWLSRRRGFIPNRWDAAAPAGMTIAEVFAQPEIEIDAALDQALKLRAQTATEMAAAAGVPTPWLEALVAGKPADPDISALRCLARTLDLPEPDFVGRAVRHLLTLEHQATPGADLAPMS